MPVFAVSYAYAPQSTGLADLLPAHREYVAARAGQGQVLMSGPLAAGEAPGALFILQVGARADAEAFVAGDPLVAVGSVVAEVSVREWEPRLGRLTALI
jgi:uncharacterized protein